MEEEEGGSEGASSMPAVNEKKVSLPAANNTSSTSTIPESLLPFLGWTKLSACHRRPTKKRNHTNWNRDEALQKVTGRAIVSIHVMQPIGHICMQTNDIISFLFLFISSCYSSSYMIHIPMMENQTIRMRVKFGSRDVSSPLLDY